LTTQTGTSNQQEIHQELDALFRLDDEDAGELLLVRHAEPASSLPDPMLSCDGLRQAERLADRLGSLWIDTIYTGSERRCFQTAKVVADQLQRPLRVLDGLADIGFDPEMVRGAPSTYTERFRRQPRWEALPGFAPGKDFRRRAVSAIESIIAAHPSRRTVVITHSSVLNSYISMVLCIPRSVFRARSHLYLHPAALRRHVRLARLERHGAPGGLRADPRHAVSFYPTFTAVNKSLNRRS
jgi:2,3-bisphosphoglycerate-dependent phosphoglycerate mutase